MLGKLNSDVELGAAPRGSVTVPSHSPSPPQLESSRPAELRSVLSTRDYTSTSHPVNASQALSKLAYAKLPIEAARVKES